MVQKQTDPKQKTVQSAQDYADAAFAVLLANPELDRWPVRIDFHN